MIRFKIFDIVNLLLENNEEKDRRPSVVILECFNCQWEGSEVGRWDKWVGIKVGR